MSMKSQILLCSLICFSITYIADAAQQSEQETAVDLERIEVTGIRPLAFFREQLSLTKQAMLDTFNNEITNADMHFVCKRQQKENSRIHEEVCRSAFEIRIREELMSEGIRSGENLLDGISIGSGSAAIGTKELDKLKGQKAVLIEELAKTNERFKASIIEYNKAKFYFEKAHADKFGKLSPYFKN